MPLWRRTAPNPDWSPLADQLLYTIDPSVHLANLDGTGDALLLPYGVEPAWSPDGRHIAFAAGVVGMKSDAIFIANADGSGTRELTFPPNLAVYDQSPAWSHDGKRIVFTREDETNRGAWGLRVIPADGGNDIPITPDTLFATHADW